MGKTIESIIEALRKNHGWTVQPARQIAGRPDISTEGVFVLETPEREQIALHYSRTARTGVKADRKPQIRFFLEKSRNAYKYAKYNGIRFFTLLFCETPLQELALDASIRPDNYVVSIETPFDETTTKRADIRSMYEQIAKHTNDNRFFRVYSGEHKCRELNQAAFIRISNDSDTIDTTVLLQYLTMFDNRPYMSDNEKIPQAVPQENGQQGPDFHDMLYAVPQQEDQAGQAKQWNWLVFGAPGTGKSFYINQELEDWAQEAALETMRVTFYEDYTYTQFVGGYMPIPEPNMTEYSKGKIGDQEITWQLSGERVSYRFCPGPFIRMLARAYEAKLKNEKTKFVLVIEELNRSNAPCVFGDMFQLLDRSGGISDYEITPAKFMQEYLLNEIQIGDLDLPADVFQTIRLPDNFYIWATMNNADQGVFPLDTAFKRRWSILYRDIDGMDAGQIPLRTISIPMKKNGVISAVKIDWNTFRMGINKIISSVGLDEDRCIGYWFFSEEEINAINSYTEISVKGINGDAEAKSQLGAMATPLVDKLLSYLRQDVFRNAPGKFFHEGYKAFSAVRHGLKWLEANDQLVDLLSITKLEADSFREVDDSAGEASEV